MRADLIHFRSTDGLKLPGLLINPDRETKSVAIFLHGNGTSSIFYSELITVLGKNLTELGVAFFPFNNRGAHLIKTLWKKIGSEDVRIRCGTAFELIKDCIYDIDGAIDFLKSKGFDTFYLMGESTGANKIAVYNFYKPENAFKKYILLSGGDDTGLYYHFLGKQKFHKILEKSKLKVESGRGEDFVPQYVSNSPMSYQSIYDTINPDGDYNVFPYNEALNILGLSQKQPLFDKFSKIKKPTLVVYGGNDEFCYGKVCECMEILKKHTNNAKSFEYLMVEGADHGFHGKEEELSKIVSEWLIRASQ